MAKARAAVQVDDRRIEIKEFDLPKIGPDAGLLRLEACGMCGSDVEQYDGAFRQLGLRYPVIPGHEICWRSYFESRPDDFLKGKARERL